MIATVFLALGMGIAMAQTPTLSLSSDNQDVTAAAGSTDFTVATNIAAGDLTVTADTWTEATNAAAWSAREDHTSVVFDGKMWVIGGTDGSRQNDVWNSVDGITWTQVTTTGTTWSAREDHASVVFDGKMWVIGGTDGSRQNDVWNSVDGITWTEAIANAPWSTRSSHTSVVFDNKMWVIGGGVGFTPLADVWNSVDGVTWTQVATTGATWSARANHTSVVFGGKMWVIGGLAGNDFSLQNDVWSSTDGITWTQATADAGWSARANHTSVVFGGKMWVIGGTDGSSLNNVWHSTDGITWTEVTADAGWLARSGHTSVVFGNKMWVIGGLGSSRQNDVYFSAGDWLAASLSGTTLTADYEANGIINAPRTGTVTISGSGMTAMATVTQAGVVPELALSPANQDVTAEAGTTPFTVTTNIPSGDLTITADTWTEATNAAGWSARFRHTSVVFGGKMWVIGGSDNNSARLNDVWSSTDGITWTQAVANAAWSRRWGHTSVVFGGKMWVIGGYDGARQTDVWNSTDGITWTKVTTTDMIWSGRWGHASVVFDNKMWVIGGAANLDGSSRLDDVWHSTDGITWTQAVASATWSARTIHTSVVFDNKMWVIGGFDGSSQDDVWSSTDGIAWTQATVDAAWSARHGHTSVVFEGKMWVIGGSENVIGSSRLDDVWISTDGTTWTQATSDAAWSARDSHTSVVFDNNMWVIGGDDGSFRQDDVYFSAGDWLDASQSGTTLTADYEANGIFDVPRTGTVTISGEGLTQTVTVTQAGVVPALALIPTNQDVTAEAGSTDFTVTTNIPSGDLTGVATSEGEWTEATDDAAWSARDGHTSVVRNDTIWVIGGDDGSDELNDVWHSTDGITWTEATAGADWSARDGHASVVRNDTIWVIGGYDGSDELNDVWHSTDGITWTEATAGADWSARDSHTSVVRNDTIWVIGGYDGSDVLNDVWHSTDGITWTQATAGAGWSARDSHTSVVRNDTIWVIGGDNGSVLYDDVWHSTDGITWTQATADAAWSARRGHTSVVFDNDIWVIGGDNGSNELDDVWYSTDGITWTQDAADVPWSARDGHTSVVYDDDVWVIGGYDGTNELDDVFFFGGWLAASLSGTTLTADYGANGIVNVPRTGTITVSGLALTETVTVTQAGIPTELALSPANQDVTAATGSTNFTVTTNLSSDALTITDDADWLTVGLSGSDSPYTLTADYEVNSIAAPRTGTMTVSGGGLTETVTVTQEGAVPELALSPANQDVTAETGSTTFTVTTNVPSGDLTITADADWLTVSLSGTTLTADYEANGIVDVPRTGIVTVSGGGLTETVTVTQAGAAPELALSPATQNVTAEAGSTNFTVTTNLPSGDLTITDDADWLTVSLSGTTLTADYEANGIVDVPRTGTVTVSGGGLTETVTVTQAGAAPELALSPATQDVSAEAGSTNFTVTTNVPSGDLTITDDADWLTVSLSGTSSPYMLTADYEANSSTSPRTGTVTVSGGGFARTVTVVQAQAGVTFELALSPATQSVTGEAGSTDFMVTTNLPADALTITDDADWLTVSLSGTSSPYTLTATYEAKSITSPRAGIVTVSGGGLTEMVAVVQAETGVTFVALSPATQSVTAEAGSTNFTVTTNVPSGDLTITDDADWLTVSLSGTALTADYEANSNASARTGTVTVSGGGLTEMVTVVQAQAGVTFELALSPATQSVTNEAGSTDFMVTTNLPSDALTITDDADWLTVSLSGTSSPYTLTATYETNEGTDPRTGTVTVSGGGLTETVTLTQAQAGLVFELSLSPAVQSVTNEAGTTDFTVTTNVPADALTTTDDADWLTTELSGTTLTATYEANEGTDPRTGTVTVSGGGLTETVTVEQEGTPLGLEDETALVVYPNPGSAQVTVDFGDMAQGEGKAWRLLDPSGKNMRSGWVARGEATLVINTQGLLSGLYLFQVRGEGQKSYVSHRVVIRR